MSAVSALGPSATVIDRRYRKQCGERRLLPFRELETFPRAGLPGFFSLFHARIPAEQTIRFQRTAQIAIDLKKGA